jgi:hypothetical protein
MVKARSRPLYPRETDPVPTVQETVHAPGPFWKDGENLAPPGIDPRTAVARRVTLYRLSYHGPHKFYVEASNNLNYEMDDRKTWVLNKRDLSAEG